MKKLTYALFAISIALAAIPGAALFAQYDFNEALDDLDQVAVAVNDIFGSNLGQMSYLGDPVGYAIVPHVTIGVSGGAVFVPLSDINLGTSMAVDFADFGDLAYLPIPAVGAHAKFSVAKKFELGVKLAGIPEIENKNASAGVRNLIIGGKVRYNLWSFKLPAVKGGVSVGGLYEYMSGGLTLTKSDTIPIDVEGVGDDKDGTFTTTTGFETAWNASTLGAEVQGNVQVIFLNIFAGTRISKTFGKSTTTLKGTGTLSDDGGGFVTPDTQLVSVSREDRPSGLDPFVYGGVEVKLLGLVLSGKGTYAIDNDNFLIEGGLRLQF